MAGCTIEESIFCVCSAVDPTMGYGMDLATILGGVIGTALVFVVMALSGSILMYWDFMSLVIVLGGALCSSMMRWPLQNFIGGVQVGLQAITNSLDDPVALIDRIIDLADKARKNSILSLDGEQIDNEFLAKGVRLAVDGADPEFIKAVMADEIAALRKKLADGRGIFEDMGEACPAFGMIGTVIGLIVIMANLADPSKIGPGLAVALVTTLYGSLIANMFFIPISKKLKYRSTEQVRNYEICRTGVLAILSGMNPKMIRERLETHLT